MTTKDNALEAINLKEEGKGKKYIYGPDEQSGLARFFGGEAPKTERTGGIRTWLDSEYAGKNGDEPKPAPP